METMPMYSHEMPRGATPLGVCFIAVIILMALAINIVYVIAFCKIFAKAGYSWALGLLMLVPIANFVMPLVLGFGSWPIEKELETCRKNRPAGAVPPANAPLSGS